MATAAPTSISTREITRNLGRLRTRLRQWLFVHGFARWLWLILAIVSVDVFLDRTFKMDFAQRLIVLLLASAAATAVLIWRVLKPLGNPIRDDALLLQVEHQHPELHQRAISAYQLARDANLGSKGVSEQLTAAIIKSGIESARQVNFLATLDRVRGRRNWVALLAGLVAILFLAAGVANTEFLGTWFRRNVLLTNDQWPQATYLEIVGVQDGVLHVPRGSDHRQLVRVSPDSSVQEVDVSLEVDATNGRTIHLMKATGREDGREHAFMFHSVASEFRMRAFGGDDETDWVDVRMVEPPALNSLTLNSILPEYTGLSAQTLDGAGPHSVLVGSQLEVIAATNKPLAKCQLKFDEQLIDMRPTGEARNEFRVRLPSTATPSTVETERTSMSPGVAGGKYEFSLSDDNGLTNLREFSFAIRTRDDREPDVRARLLGISGLVVPRALIPVSYTIIDEYGLTRIDFDCRWTAEVEVDGPTSAAIPVAQIAPRPPVPERQDVAVLQLESLRLAPGTSLRIVLQACDNQPESQGVGKSREFLLRVVTEEELLADLLRREIEQRKMFQQAYDAQMELVSLMRQLIAAPSPGQTPEQRRDQLQTDLIANYRAQRAIGTAADAVAKRFEEYLVEVQNNRLDEETRKIDPSRTIESRFDNEIIKPIHRLDQELVTEAARNLDNCRRNLDDSQLFQLSVDKTIAVQESILDLMRQILAAMEDSENYQEIVNRLLEIKRSEERVKQQLKSKGQPEKIFDDQTKGVFDDDK